MCIVLRFKIRFSQLKIHFIEQKKSNKCTFNHYYSSSRITNFGGLYFFFFYFSFHVSMPNKMRNFKMSENFFSLLLKWKIFVFKCTLALIFKPVVFHAKFWKCKNNTSSILFDCLKHEWKGWNYRGEGGSVMILSIFWG